MFIEKETQKHPFGLAHDQHISSVKVKGRPGALEFVLDEEAPLTAILHDLEQLLTQNASLLQGASAWLHFSTRPLDHLQLNEIRRVFQRHRIPLQKLSIEISALQDFLEDQIGLPVSITRPAAASPAPFPSPSLDTPAPLPPLLLDDAPPPTRQHTQPEALSLAPSTTAPIASSRRPSYAPPSSAPPYFSSSPAPLFSTTPSPSSLPPSSPLPPAAAQTDARSRRDGLLHERLQQRGLLENPAPSAGKHTTKGYEEEDDLNPELALPDALLDFPQSNENHSAQQNSKERTLHKIMRTCRAGTRLDLEGDVLVFGDVNPGAEIRATGDILIFGALRGLAHAGSQGNRRALIAAFDLSPTQLRISDQFALSPETPKKTPRNEMEVAFLNAQNQIEVEKYQGRLPSALSND